MHTGIILDCQDAINSDNNCIAVFNMSISDFTDIYSLLQGHSTILSDIIHNIDQIIPIMSFTVPALWP